MKEIVITAIIVGGVVALGFIAGEGCSRNQERYYKLAGDCLQSGGSWIRTSSGNQCIFGQEKKP